MTAGSRLVGTIRSSRFPSKFVKPKLRFIEKQLGNGPASKEAGIVPFSELVEM